MNDNGNSDTPPRRSSRGFTLVLIAVLALTLAFYVTIRPQKFGGLSAGEKAPAIRAEGWLNSTPLTPADFEGKLVVIDAWASWCGPCRNAAPELVALHDEYAPKGVVFVGLSSEPEEFLEPMQRFLKNTKITWPNGYGATETLMELQADYIPCKWLVGPEGVILWSEDSPESLEEAIQKALP